MVSSVLTDMEKKEEKEKKEMEMTPRPPWR